ncbi:hypothetical protein ABZ192_36510 [Streptomyces sp. NPDC006235]|uniref:hypothetical protein n=1 Tax=Streptomyces sp. NPDC006235 TaxID=3156736 RepID=UPI0033B32B54
MEPALRNTPPTDDAEAMRHVERCDRCRDELRMMTRVVTAARSAELEDMPAAPPELVWQRMAQGLSRESAPPPHRPTAPEEPRPQRKAEAPRRTRPRRGRRRRSPATR